MEMAAKLVLLLGTALFLKVVVEDYTRGLAGFWSLDMRERVVREKLGSGLVAASMLLHLKAPPQTSERKPTMKGRRMRRRGRTEKWVDYGGYDKEEKAARVYDLAALKYWGPTAATNFPVGTPFTVDAFHGQIDGCSAYFLSHFHHDHYGGLSKKWSHGTIYCSPLTARLVQTCLSVNSLYICPSELDTEHAIEGAKVTLLEANHCPGAVLIHFRLADGRCYLHTGDFRASKLMQSHAVLLNQRVSILFLDTTYCNHKYRFPPKEDVVDFILRISQDNMKRQPKTLIVVSAYSIGKENVYLAIAQALGVQIYTNVPRRRVPETFNWPELSKKLCTLAESSPLHVLPIYSLSVSSTWMARWAEDFQQKSGRLSPVTDSN